MPPRRRTEKRRVDRLTPEQRMDLVVIGGPLGRRGNDGRVGRVWEDEAHRRAAWEAHRESLLARFRAGDAPPPKAADEFETDPEYHRAAVAYWVDRVRGTSLEEAVREATDAGSARAARSAGIRSDAARRAARPRVYDDQASAAALERRRR